METTLIFKQPFHVAPYSIFVKEILDEAKKNSSKYVCLANVHMLIEAVTNKSFHDVFEKADFITPDGRPIAWAIKFFHGISQERVAGMDLLPDLLKEAEIAKLSVYFYGGTDLMVDKTNLYIKSRYPNLPVAGTYSPPFRNLTPDEDHEIVNRINKSGAKIVFVVLGCPKQEKWMAENKGKVNAVMIGIGGALPVLIGLRKRAPKWMQRWGLEWFYRLAQDPKRLWKRYLFTNSAFIYLVLKERTWIFCSEKNDLKPDNN